MDTTRDPATWDHARGIHQGALGDLPWSLGLGGAGLVMVGVGFLLPTNSAF
jgi:hypothetical protein